MERYGLDYLIGEFGKHNKEFTSTKHYKSDDFNLPRALSTLVIEIIELRAEIAYLKKLR